MCENALLTPRPLSLIADTVLHHAYIHRTRRCRHEQDLAAGHLPHAMWFVCPLFQVGALCHMHTIWYGARARSRTLAMWYVFSDVCPLFQVGALCHMHTTWYGARALSRALAPCHVVCVPSISSRCSVSHTHHMVWGKSLQQDTCHVVCVQ